MQGQRHPDDPAERSGALAGPEEGRSELRQGIDITREAEPFGSTDDLGIPGLVDATVIGRGGSGVVYRARQPALNRVVAVKVLSAAMDKTGQERFQREIFVMGTLAGHPHIVQVFAVGETRFGRGYILMPFVGGGSLADRPPMDWSEAVQVVIKLCGALETAHQAGVLHRDLKPANVLVSDYGEPLLADFGISRMSGGFETSAGRISASLPFAPPEILSGRPASVQGDVYSLAATLFCLLVGTPPFASQPGEEVVSVYLRISRDPVPNLRAVGIPAAMATAIESALAKLSTERPRSAVVFGRLLQEVQRSHGIPVTAMTLPAASLEPVEHTTDVVLGPGLPAEGAQLSAVPDPPIPPGFLNRTQRLGRVGGRAPAGTRRHVQTMLDTPASDTRPGVRTRRPKQPMILLAIGLVLALAVVGVVLFVQPKISDPGRQNQLAGLKKPLAVAVATDGTVFIADSDRHVVQRVASDGTVGIFAGTGQPGNAGDGRPAAQATLDYPSALALARDGSVVVASGGRLRQIGADGVIRPVAGFTGYLGVKAMTFGADGTLFVAEQQAVWALPPQGTAQKRRLAGTLGYIEDIAVLPDGALIVSDGAIDQVLRIDGQGAVTRIAGAESTDRPAGDGQPAAATKLSGPSGLAVDAQGILYIAEAGMNRVRKLLPDGTLLTVAGSPDGYSAGFSGDGGPAIAATFNLNRAPMALDSGGSLYIGDVNNHRVRKVSTAGTVDTFA